jgi:hypothetical protein
VGGIGLTLPSGFTLRGHDNLGGLVGINYGTLTSVSLSISSGATVLGNGIYDVGGLVGFNRGGSALISNSALTISAGGSVQGPNRYVGGLAGQNSGSIASTSVTLASGASISGSNYVGGFVGSNSNNGGTGKISGISLTLPSGFIVSSSNAAGGFAGRNEGVLSGIDITLSSGSTVVGGDKVGGLVGQSSGSITSSTLTFNSGGVVSGTSAVGGLVGYNSGSIATSSVTFNSGGLVTASSISGGSVGLLFGSSTVGSFTGNSTVGSGFNLAGEFGYVGGLVGRAENRGVDSSITNSLVTFNNGGTISGPMTIVPVFIDIVSGQSTTYGTEYGLQYWFSTSASANTFDATLVPTLLTSASASFGTVQTFTAGASSISFNAFGLSGSIALNTPLTATLGATSSTSLTLTPSLTFSGLRFSAGNSQSFTVNKAPLGISLSAFYSSSTTVSPAADSVVITGLKNSETLAPTSVTVNSANVASSNNFVTAILAKTSDSSANLSNYFISTSFNGTDGITTTNKATLTPAVLTVTNSVAHDKTYDGLTTASITGGVLSGVLGSSDGSNLSLVQTGNFSQSNVGTNLTVTANDSITGAASTNYVLTQPTISNTANINFSPKTLSSTAQAQQTAQQSAAVAAQQAAQTSKSSSTPPPVANGTGSSVGTGTSNGTGSSSGSRVTANTNNTTASGDSSTSGTSGNTGSGATTPGISISVNRPASVEQSGVVSVQLPKDMATSGTGFSFALPAQVTGGDVAQNAASDTIKVTLVNGAKLPSWIKFDPEAKLFTASSVPDGAFPLQVLVTTGALSTTVVISERDQR